MAQTKWFDEGKGTGTPWGRAQAKQNLTRGVVFYSTAGHGGLCVAPGWAKRNLTPQARFMAERWGGKLWYEEDCACNVVFFEHQDLLETMTGRKATDEDMSLVRQSVERYQPGYFDPEFIQKCIMADDVPDPQNLRSGDIVTFLTKSPNAVWRGIVYSHESKKDLLVQMIERAGLPMAGAPAIVRCRLSYVQEHLDEWVQVKDGKTWRRP